jgi:SAM-dependent methyltransferase
VGAPGPPETRKSAFLGRLSHRYVFFSRVFHEGSKMAKPSSLDELISAKAGEFAHQVRAAAAIADKEEEIRIEVEKQLAFVQKEAGIKLQGKHEFTVASGRVDSVYNAVVIEYKNPSSPAARIGPGANSPGAKKVVEQIKSRFYDMRTQDTLNTLFGVGCDGNYFIFVRYYNDKWQVQDPVEITKHSAERFLWALFNLGSKGKRFEPDYLAGDFGSGQGSVAQDGIKILYDAISTTSNPKAQTFFNQWKILFGEVCGYDVDNPSDKIKKLADFYGVSAKGVKPAEMLFAVHTYYALFMKLLAGEIIGHFHKLPSLIGRMIAAPSAAKLRGELAELEAGGVFRHLGITNFLEGDLFAWYLPAWSDEIEVLIRKMTARLDQYNPGTLAEEPAESRDMLKKLYQQLFPKSVRHDLGEYYTPDWLADHVLNELGYVGDPDKRILDPACGSGTFLVMAIARIRAWYEANREKCRYDEGELCKKILANVIGFDLNPLAVMAARTNYLIAIRDLVSHVDKVEIPVYLCDSILTPSAYGGLFAGTTTAAKELKTSAAKFLIPIEIATSAHDVANYAEQLEFCVRNGYGPNEFLQRCQDEGLPITEKYLHMDLYKELVALDKANRNGVWARIIKNAFAPLFVGKVDYVAGNPPWVNWEHLPDEYRQATAPLWQTYSLFTLKGYKQKLGGSKDDISILLTYVAHDHYLADTGSLGFVITQSIFKTKGGGQGFRSLRYSNGKTTHYFAPIKVDDLTAFQPFEGAANKTAVFVAGKALKPVEYPIPFRVWAKRDRTHFDQDASLAAVTRATTRRSLLAEPIDPNDKVSPWLTAPQLVIDALYKVRGTSTYKPRKGVYCATNCIYWLTEAKPLRADEVMITNLADSGKKQVNQVTQAVEKTFVHRLLRGKDVGRWAADPSLWIILPQQSENPAKAVSIPHLKRSFPKTFAYFRQFESEIRACALLAQFFDPEHDPFYSSYNIGYYTFSPRKVVWKEICPEIQAAVIVEEKSIVIPDHKLVMIDCRSIEEAFFVSGVLNSTPISLLVRAYATHTSISGHIAEFARIPKFSHSVSAHVEIAKIAKECQSLASAGSPKLASTEKCLDAQIARMWGINSEELHILRDELLRLRGSRPISGH